MPVNDLEPLLVYLREHGQRYSRERLRQELVAQGYDPEQVDEALAAFARERAAEAPMKGIALRGCVVGCGYFALVGVLALASDEIVTQNDSWPIIAFAVAAAAGLAAGAGLMVTGRRGGHENQVRWGAALLLGILASLGLPLIIFGGCVGMFNILVNPEKSAASAEGVRLLLGAVAGLAVLGAVLGGIGWLARRAIRQPGPED